jgi:tetratricopeptide (TPR) repeat protein
MPVVSACLLPAVLAAAAAYGFTPAEATQVPAKPVENAQPSLAEIVRRPVPLRPGVGNAHEVVETSSRRAQEFYDQGLAYLHAFVWIEAARSFNEALRADGGVALAHVGLSYALGELGDSDGARRAAKAADNLAAKATGRERLRVRLRSLQLEASAKPGDAAAAAAYKKELESAVSQYPADVELLLLVGRAQGPSLDAHGMHVDSSALRFYERALAEAPDYFAVHHYLTHAYENVNRIDRALDHAAAFARLAPAIPHAHHMHGHVLRHVGRMPEAVAKFRLADELGLEYLRREAIPASYDWHYRHNLDLLGTSYQYLGQVRAAEETLRRAFELPATSRLSEELNRREWPLFLLARGRAGDALRAATSLTEHPLPLVQALGHILVSRALTMQDRLDAAAGSGNAALRLMREAGPTGGILVPELQLAQGEHLLKGGQTDKGRALVLDGVAKLRAQSGPDSWIQTLFAIENGARMARERGNWQLAAELSDQMNQHDASYAGSAYAAALLAEHRGSLAAARSGYQAAAERWKQADGDFLERQDAVRRLAALKSDAPARN